MQRLIIRLTVAFLTFMLGIIVSAIWATIHFQSNDGITPTSQFQAVKSLSLPEEIVTNSSAINSSRVSPLRKIDFANFTYPEVDEDGANSRKTFTLKHGEHVVSEIVHAGFPVRDVKYLVDVRYGDVTGDGIGEALVVLNEETGGTAIPYYAYIYTLKNARPRLLWSFVAGDRADGGLRKIYAEDSELVIELYGKGTRIGGELYGTENAGACCALSVTRTRYQWNGTEFIQKGESVIYPNPAGNSSYLE